MNEVKILEVPNWVLKEISQWITSEKYGYIQLNTQAGKIININKHETVKQEW